MPDEIDLNNEEESALDRAWAKIKRDRRGVPDEEPPDDGPPTDDYVDEEGVGDDDDDHG